jgi:Putative adhesin
MPQAQSSIRNSCWIAVCTLLAIAVPWTLVHAGRAIDEHRAAEPQGEVEIVNVSGKVEVDGWDRSEVEVTGTAGDNVERVDIMSAGNRTSIHVVTRSSRSWGFDGEAHLIVHVPAKSAVTATLVSADFKVMGVAGDLKLQTVSGQLSGEAGGDVRASTVSGDVRLTARAAKTIEIKTISGDIHLTGGGGDVDITTVSGSATLDLADVSRARFKSVSGDLTAALALVADGQIESESVSGDVSFKFAGTPAAEFDVQSFSGDIKNCFGPKPLESRYGPGSRLSFKNGEGHGNVRVNTKSGDVRLCVKGMSSTHTSALSLAQVSRSPMVVPYVY